METQWRVTAYEPASTKNLFPPREYDTACAAALFIGLAGTMFDDICFHIERRAGESWKVVGTMDLIDAADKESGCGERRDT